MPEKRISQCMNERIGLIVILLVLGLVVLSIGGYLFEWSWTGLPASSSGGKKTLWDWFNLIIIPMVLAAGTIWFKKAQAQSALEIEQQRAQEATLEAYLDSMSSLLLHEGLRDSKEGSAVQNLAQTRTVLALRRLDANRRNHVLHFLGTARLLGRINPLGDEEKEAENARVALLAGANLQGMDLSGAELSGVNLSWTTFSDSNLQGARFVWANLSNARFRRADLQSAHFCSASLTYAKFYKAKLRGADLGNTNLQGAHFGSADLRGVKNLTCEQLHKTTKFESAYRDPSLACGLPIPKPPVD